ncbi:tape measure protein [Corynebacterium variabile]|uniref:aggregation-promoting factor C-terminal-like domain-containing protein n=1 Tax=Corynebacterium variabile TaxID=1727 RepID=UPI002FDFA11B
MAEAIGYAVLPVTLSIQGASAQLTKQLVSPAQNAAKKASESVRKQLASGADAAAKAVESARNREVVATRKVVDAEKSLKSARDTAEQKAKAVESAELKLQAARSTAKSKVADAEKKLADLRSSGKASAEQLQSAERNLESVRATQGAKVIDAENRVQSARSASIASADKAAAAEDKLTTAKSRASDASQAVIDATRRLDDAQAGAAASADNAQGAFGRLRAKMSELKDGLFGAKDGADTAGSAASKMGGDFDGAHGSSESLAGSLGGFAKKAGLAAAAFAGLSGIGSTISAGFDKVNKIEDTTASLEIMMGSAERATDVMDQLRESNQNTPYTFDAWSEAGKNLVAFGIDADKTAGIVTALGEAASASGKGEDALNSMGRAFGTAAASGKISMETINSLAEGGVNGLAILANDAGVTTAEMQKMISGGTVPAADAIDVLTKGIMEGSQGAAGETKALTGTMEAMSETTSGRLTNMKSAFTNLAGSVMGAVAPAISAAAEKITEFVYAIKGWVDGLIDGEGAMSGVKKAIDVMMPVLKPLAFIIGSVTGALIAMKVAQLAQSKASDLAAKATEKFGKALGFLMKHPIVAALAAIAGALIYFFTQTETGKKVWDELMEKLKVVGAWISDTFGPIFERLGEIISGAWDGIKVAFDAGWSAIQPIFDVMGAVFSTIWDGLQLAWSAIGQPILDLIVGAFGLWWQGVKLYFDFLKNLFTTVWDGLQIAWNAVGQPVLNVIIGAFNIMKEGLALAFRLVRASFEVLWEAVKRAWDAIGRPIVDFIVAVFNRWWSGMQRIFGWVRAGWDALWGAVRAGWDAVGRPVVDTVVSVFGWFRDQIKAAFDIVSGFASDLWNDISTYFGKIFNKIGEVKDKVLQPFKDAGSWLVDAGKNIIDGLLNGIGDLGKKITDWFLDKIPGWMKEPFKKALGIHSPSRVFKGYGKNVGQGLIDGIDAMGTKVEKATENMASRVTDVDMPTLTPDIDTDTIHQELATAYAGGDFGYGATGDAIGDRAGRMAVNAAATVGAASRGDAAGAKLNADLVGADIAPALDQQGQAVDAFGKSMSSTILDVIDPMWGQMGQGLTDVKTNLVDPAFAGLQSGLTTVGNTVATVTGTQVNPMWTQMGNTVTAVKTTLVDPAFAGVQAGVQATGKWFTDTVTGVMNPQWSSMGSHLLAVKDGSILPAFGGVQSGLDTLGGWFSRTVDNIGTAWDRMRGATGRPAKFVVQTVFNDGIKKAWDSISDMIGEKKMAAVPLGNLGAYASGGVLPGYTPGKDVHRFTSRTGGTLDLSGGEAIMRPEWTRAVGGPAAVERMNADARSGSLRRKRKKYATDHEKFADGGVWRSLWAAANAAFPNATLNSAYRPGVSGYHGRGAAVDIGGPMQQVANWIYKTYPNSAQLIWGPGPLLYNVGGNKISDQGQLRNQVYAGDLPGHYDHVHWASDGPITSDGKMISMAGGSAGGAMMVSLTDSVKEIWDDAMKAIPKWGGGPGDFGGVPPKWKEKAADRTWKKIKKEADKIQTASGLVSTAGIANGPNREMGKQMAARVGWTGDKWDALDQLWQHESGWNHLAQNPSSTAFGIPQFLDSTWASVGVAKTSDPKQQIAAGIKYIQQRPDYQGDPRLAWQLWNSRSPHWYDNGGQLKPGTTLAQNDTGKTEAVLTNGQWTDVSGLVGELSKLVPAVRSFAPQIQSFVDDNPQIQQAVEVGTETMKSFNEQHPNVGAEVQQSMTDDALDFFGMKGAWFTDVSQLGIEWQVPVEVEEATDEASSAADSAADAATSAAEAAESAAVSAEAIASASDEATVGDGSPSGAEDVDSVPAPAESTVASEPQMEKKTLDNSTVVNFVVENVQASDPQEAAREVMREARRVLAAFV